MVGFVDTRYLLNKRRLMKINDTALSVIMVVTIAGAKESAMVNWLVYQSTSNNKTQSHKFEL